MEPPITLKPMPASAAKLPLDHTNKLFGIVYITLTGVIDTIVPAAGPWSWLGKSMSYLIKLAPILWWALPTQSATRQFPDASKPASQGWFPDIMTIYFNNGTLSPKMLIILGASCMFFVMIITYYTFMMTVVNNGIHHVLILPLVGHFEDKYLAFALDSQNKLVSASGNMIVWFPDSVQLTCSTHAFGK
ncbi:hypothetical protein DSO57_1010522 [Entomophthora muscae]|uniref:Uncharacterized protein n=1 Tax=Entomophthora muscae TaxID=34485 RepID=A0ACC2U4A7_9FUNG|nr:hypothetical protein DSO57_1010522 [Entomophthora muscae]